MQVRCLLSGLAQRSRTEGKLFAQVRLSSIFFFFGPSLLVCVIVVKTTTLAKNWNNREVRSSLGQNVCGAATELVLSRLNSFVPRLFYARGFKKYRVSMAMRPAALTARPDENPWLNTSADRDASAKLGSSLWGHLCSDFTNKLAEFRSFQDLSNDTLLVAIEQKMT